MVDTLGLLGPSAIRVELYPLRVSRELGPMSSPRRRRSAIRECEHDPTHRLFNCGCCGLQVRICSRCDHGNIYCRECAPICRAESIGAAGRRYQDTPEGALKHADRQSRYRERLLQDVTHQGSVESPELPKENVEQTLVATAVTTAEVAIAPEDPAAPGLGLEAVESGNDESWTEPTPFVHRDIPWTSPSSEVYQKPRCDFCGRRCGVYSRLGFLRRR